MMNNENIIEINEHEVVIKEGLESHNPPNILNEKYQINIEIDIKSENSDSNELQDLSYITDESDGEDKSTDTASEIGGFVGKSSSESTLSVICSSNESTITASEGSSNDGSTASLNEEEDQGNETNNLLTPTNRETISIQSPEALVDQSNHISKQNYTQEVLIEQNSSLPKGRKFQKPYVCEECNTGFTNKKIFIKHKFRDCKNSTFIQFLKSIEIKLPFQCKECNKSFVNEGDFDDHNKITKCNQTNLIKRIFNITHRKVIQQEVFPTNQEISQNNQEICLSFPDTSPDESNSSSDHSHVQTPPPTMTQEHVVPKSRLLDPNKLICVQFPQNFDPKNYLKTIICNKCNQKFPNDEMFEDHFFEEDTLTCRFCGDSNFTEESLVSHIRSRHPSEEMEESNLSCKYCKLTNLTRASYTLHIKQFHSFKNNKEKEVSIEEPLNRRVELNNFHYKNYKKTEAKYNTNNRSGKNNKIIRQLSNREK